ncbi:MAG: YceI family protein [Flavobacteriaceae bacterium]|nr:YceI family protein [Flavobacteriaceae bacterium]
MRKIILALTVVLVTISCKNDIKNKAEISDEQEVEEMNISEAVLVDAQSSKVTWRGFKAGTEHFGSIRVSEGTINIKEGNLIGGSFKFDINSITDEDMPKDDESNLKLVNHLKSPDFFDVEKFPTTSFEITEVNEVEGHINVSGNLTIKGITKNITIPTEMGINDGVVTFKSDVFAIDRTDFGMRYKSGKFFENLKDGLIRDEFELIFELKTLK